MSTEVCLFVVFFWEGLGEGGRGGASQGRGWFFLCSATVSRGWLVVVVELTGVNASIAQQQGQQESGLPPRTGTSSHQLPTPPGTLQLHVPPSSVNY